jgi:transcriptional regulator with XRE-family HTH domain
MPRHREKENHSPVGDVIAQARRSAGLSQERLAQRLNRQQSFVAKIEGGTREVEVREFLWIVQRMGFDPITFVSQLLRDANFRDLQDRRKSGRTERWNRGVDDWDDYADIPDVKDTMATRASWGAGEPRRSNRHSEI